MQTKKLFRSIFITNLGFFAAIAGNYFIPQIAKGLKISKYNLLGFEVDLNIFYRLVLTGVIIFFLISGIRAYFKINKREKYIKQSAFRFAVGIALLIFDIAGTKLRITPQPFFPGPAQVLEAFLIEGGYIFENLLYSLRLFSAGFISGVLLGVGTGILYFSSL